MSEQRHVLLRWLVSPLLRLYFGVHARGLDHLQGLEQCLFAANHNSHLDALLLLATLPPRLRRRTRPVAAADYFGRTPRLRRLMDRCLSPVWVERGTAPRETLEAMERSLEAGESLIVFPEGSRGEPGELGAFKSGVGRLMERHPQVPLVPVFLVGTERALPRRAVLPLPIWTRVVIGPPQRLEGRARDITEAVQASVEDLGRIEATRRQRRRLRRRSTFTVAVLGIDGSGKSTLARLLAKDLSRDDETCLVGDALRRFRAGEEEPFRPLLADVVRRRLGRHAKLARSLAGYKIPKLGELLLRDRLLRACRRWYDPAFATLDGSPLLNMTAWSVLYRDEGFGPEFCGRVLRVLTGRERLRRGDPLLARYPELRWLGRSGLTPLHLPDAVVLLDVPADEAVRRITARGGERQVHETTEKLERLAEAYRTVCSAAAESLHVPLLRLGGDVGPEEACIQAGVFVRSAREADDAA